MADKTQIHIQENYKEGCFSHISSEIFIYHRWYDQGLILMKRAFS
jgi:hypothetical protein